MGALCTHFLFDIYRRFQFSKQAPKWQLGKYLRFSKGDFKRSNAKEKDKEVSDSIENQRKILNESEQMNADEFEWLEEYKDDGFTGTDADRDNFQRLLVQRLSPLCGLRQGNVTDSKELYVYYQCGTYKSLLKKPAPCTQLS